MQALMNMNGSQDWQCMKVGRSQTHARGLCIIKKSWRHWYLPSRQIYQDLASRNKGGEEKQ
jgi:hypothetical protein